MKALPRWRLLPGRELAFCWFPSALWSSVGVPGHQWSSLRVHLQEIELARRGSLSSDPLEVSGCSISKMKLSVDPRDFRVTLYTTHRDDGQRIQARQGHQPN